MELEDEFEKNKKNKSMGIIICLIKFSYFQNIYYLWKMFSQRNSKYFYSEYKIWILLFFLLYNQKKIGKKGLRLHRLNILKEIKSPENLKKKFSLWKLFYQRKKIQIYVIWYDIKMFLVYFLFLSRSLMKLNFGKIVSYFIAKISFYTKFVYFFLF